VPVPRTTTPIPIVTLPQRAIGSSSRSHDANAYDGSQHRNLTRAGIQQGVTRRTLNQTTDLKMVNHLSSQQLVASATRIAFGARHCGGTESLDKPIIQLPDFTRQFRFFGGKFVLLPISREWCSHD
jgi:hypothetical protein